MSKEIVTAVGTLTLAVGIGFVMQSTDEAKDRYGVRTAPEAKMATAVADTAFMPGLRRVQLTSANDDAASRAVPVVASVVPTLGTAVSCPVNTKAQVLPGALVQLTLDAPCKQNERLIVHHNGLMFTDKTDANGSMQATIPALSEDAVFIIAFEVGRGAVVQATVSEMDTVRRAALQWSGSSGFELHALEFGADYDTPGHIWSGRAQQVEDKRDMDHGFVMRLGDPDVPQPLQAEVYTYPTETGPVDLRVETEIHANNCGLDFEVQSIQYEKGNLWSEEVVLSIPDCSVVGDLLVLSNLMDDQSIASQ